MSETRLIVARHGNTFNAGETPRRVGTRTDIGLVESGQEQARLLGLFLKAQNLVPDVVFAASLKRAYSTATLALRAIETNIEVQVHNGFDEIDYGPDENKTEEQLVQRIGQAAIDAWNSDAAVPDGWKVNPASIIETWQEFGNTCLKSYAGKTTMVVTSNGIARFSPYLTGDFDTFCQEHSIKISTGALCLFRHNGTSWKVDDWNIRPKKWFEQNSQ